MMAHQIDIITTSLEALIQRATNASNQGPDTAAISAFSALVNSEPECSQMAAKLIIAKVNSLQEWEALQALLVLETCMKRCSTHFLAEIGKFRFLNELVKLVSPKYLGAHTPEPVRRRVLELMHLWTQQFPKEVKIKEAYEMLKKQGVVKEKAAPPPGYKESLVSPKPAASILQDEEKSQLLQRLLQSKNPHDLQAANRLIKTMVKEEERCNELETVGNNCRLLDEMLDSYRDDETSEQELELIRELHDTCLSLKPTLFKLANTNSSPTFCYEVLTVNDKMGVVLSRYNSLVPKPLVTCSAKAEVRRTQLEEVSSSSSLLDLSPSPAEPPSSSFNDLTELEWSTTAGATSDLLEPTDSVPANVLEQPLLLSFPRSSPNNSSAPNAAGFDELDLLSRMLMEQSLSTASSPRVDAALGGGLMDSPLVGSPQSVPDRIRRTSDDELLLNSTDKAADCQTDVAVVSPLGHIVLSIEDVRPSRLAPFVGLHDETGVTTVIHLTANRPRADMAVYVVTTTAKSQFPIEDFLFHPVIPRYCRLRLLPPSGTSLPPHNPFLPVSAITQIMLVGSPSKEPILLKFIISYTVSDETRTEMGEIDQLPMVD